MRKVLFFCLSFILGVFVYLLVDVKRKNVLLEDEVSVLRLKQAEVDKKREEYLIKEKQLSDLKEEKKSKILKYEEVNSWNEEIKGYLD